MKKLLIVSVVAAVLLSAGMLSAGVVASDTVETPKIDIIFGMGMSQNQRNAVIKHIIGTGTGIYVPSPICLVMGHDEKIFTTSYTEHEESDISPRCMTSQYLTAFCSRCDYVNAEFLSRSPVVCCEEEIDENGRTGIQNRTLEKIFGRSIDRISDNNIKYVTSLYIVGSEIYINTDPKAASDTDKSAYTVSGELTDLSVLAEFENLTELRIINCPMVSDISFVSKLEDLRSLYIEGTNVTDLTPLYYCSSIEELHISDSPVTTFAISPENKLKVLSFGSTYINNVNFLYNCGELTSLSVSNNQVPIKNTSVIARLQNVKYLNITAPDTDFSFLSELSSFVRTLVIGGDSEIDFGLSPKAHKSIKNISVHSTHYIDLSSASDSPFLESVKLYNVTVAKTKGIARNRVERFDFDHFIFN